MVDSKRDYLKGLAERRQLNSVNLASEAFSQLILGVSALLGIFSAGEILAESPPMYRSSLNLSLNYDQCKEKAINAGKLVFSNIEEPLEDDSGFRFYGTTAAVTGTLHCIERSQGTTFIAVVSNQWSYQSGESKSTTDRIEQIMLGQL